MVRPRPACAALSSAQRATAVLKISSQRFVKRTNSPLERGGWVCECVCVRCASLLYGAGGRGASGLYGVGRRRRAALRPDRLRATRIHSVYNPPHRSSACPCTPLSPFQPTPPAHAQSQSDSACALSLKLRLRGRRGRSLSAPRCAASTWQLKQMFRTLRHTRYASPGSGARVG